MMRKQLNKTPSKIYNNVNRMNKILNRALKDIEGFLVDTHHVIRRPMSLTMEGLSIVRRDDSTSIFCVLVIAPIKLIAPL